MTMRRAWAIFVLAGLFSLPSAAAVSQEEKLIADGSLDEAVVLLQNRVQRSPGDAAAFHLLTRAYLLEERWQDAITAAEAAVRLQPNDSGYYMWLGRAYGQRASRVSVFRAMRLAGRVRDSFQRAVQLDGNNVAARSDLAEFYMEAPGILGGGRDKAAGEAEVIAKLDAGAGHWLHARLAEKDNDSAGAEKHYSAAAEAAGGYRWLDLADFYQRNRRLKEMDAAIEKALAGQARSPQMLLGAAQLLLRAEHRLPHAAQLLRSHLAGEGTLDAPRFLAHHVLGSVLEKQGERKAALDEQRAALALASRYPPARDALSRLQG
jgi:protein involved in temperature-dependent protein secretion